ncbi:MAG TPA: hypothetical protein PLP61_08395, partial [Nocardioides sp.]|uniref:hypothetical protein n=1 Tax=Nocardioides sp. TaxID=35761 RepID=UPI002CB26283
LMGLAEAHRWRGDWASLLNAVEQATAVADQIGDVRLLGRAASAMTIGALWRSAPAGQVNEDVVAALRRSLAELPAADDPLRSRVMLALANELHYGATFEERTALVEQALAMARRLDHPGAVMDAALVGFMALWRPDTAEQRLDLATEAMAIASTLGAERSFTVAATLTAVAHGELGQVQQMGETGALARDYAERLRIPYGVMVLDALEVPWLAMAGRFAEAEQRLESVALLAERMQVHEVGEALAAVAMALRLWQGRVDEVLPDVLGGDEGSDPLAALQCLLLLRAGRLDQAREHLATHPVVLDPVDTFSLLNWSAAAETALAVGDRDLGAAAYTLLAPYAGRCACAGPSMALGPVDAFLALAAAASGEVALAVRHADDARALTEQWRIPLAAQWLDGQRERFGF